MTRLVAVVSVVLAVVVVARAPAAEAPIPAAAAYLGAHQTDDGGFAEPGRKSDPQLTAWAVLGLSAARTSAEAGARALGYLRASEGEPRTALERALHLLARAALGDRDPELVAAVRAYRPGRSVNTTIWTILALRGAGQPAPRPLVAALLAAQHRSGGWSWARGVAPDSNDTAAAIQALRAAGVRGAAIERGLGFLERHRRRDGGFALAAGRPADTQSTAWAIQAHVAAGRAPGAGAFRYLARMRRPDGSYRYSAAYVTTPVWVTAQVLPALARRAYPLS